MSDTSDEETPFVPPPNKKRVTRQRNMSEKLKQGLDSLNEELLLDPSTMVVVQCCQTGRQHTAKIKDLSREDAEPLMPDDFVSGASFILNYDKKPYPVKFLKFKEKVSKKRDEAGSSNCTDSAAKGGKAITRGGKGSGKDKGKRKLIEGEDLKKVLSLAKDDTNTPKEESQNNQDSNDVAIVLDSSDKDIPTPISATVGATMLDNSDKDLIVNLAKQVQKMEKALKQLVQNNQSHRSNEVSSYDSTSEPQELGLRRISARDAYSYALQAMDILFTKEEMGQSLLFKSKKSAKPGLDQKRVEKLLGLVEKKFGNNWDIKILTQKANQKCRDSIARPIKQESSTGSSEPGIVNTADEDTNDGED